MSSIEEEKHLPEDVSEINEEARKGTKISYTRDFLMSFKDSDACKKFPSGFDQANEHLGELIQDRQRPSGGLPLNSLRRNEYGSSPPTRGDSSGYSRGIQGRWDSRSSGRSDRDSDTQSDLDSDSSRRYGNQPRRSWQVPEHDGLLGSGSFPRPSGFASGTSAPKGRPNEQYQLNRSTEPYQPPRPYKAAPHSRRDTDAFNNETFGSSECTDEERAEEERQRRAAFEMMRKEQHKTFQPEKRVDFDISTLVEESKDENRSLKRGSDAEDPTAKDNDAEKASASSHAPAARPLVPPGFTSAAADRSTVAKSVAHSHTEEVEKGESGDSHLLLGKRNSHALDDQEEKRLAREMSFRKQQSTSSHASINDQSAFEALKSSEVVNLNVEKVISPSMLGDSNQDRSTSILNKLFTNSVALTDAGSSAVVHHETQADETQDFQSSKFACWFNEEDKKLGNNHVSGQPNELLSFIAGEKGGTRVSGNKSQKSSPSLTFPNAGSGEMLAIESAEVGSFDKLNKENKREPLSGVFTCEDLEQSMLSEVSVDVPILQPPVQSWTNPNGKSKQPKSSTDNLASQHLLSLLQKGPSLKETESSSNIGSSYAGNVSVFEESSIGVVQNTREANVKSTTDSANNLTLETLFGSAFMKELQSVGAPVSSQRGPLGTSQPDVSEPRGFPFPAANNNHESEFSSGVLNDGAIRKQTSMDSRIKEPWLKFDDLQAELNSSQLKANFGHKIVGFNALTDVGLPEEDSFIAGSNAPGGATKTDFPPSLNAQMDFAEKFGAFNTGFRDERSMRGAQEIPFRRGPFEMREPGHLYQNTNIPPTFAQLQNNMGTHMDSRAAIMNSQMKFMSPEGAPNQRMPMNMVRPAFRHPSSGFDQPIPQAMLQQMQMQQGNFPPNMIHGPSPPNRSAPMSAHPNFPGLGMSPPAHDVGGASGHHPEVLQRLIEMELRSNPKQIRPMTSGGQSQRMYGHELDMGFGFR